MYNNYKAAVNQYKTQSIITASPEELTLKLYNGCLRFISIGKEAIKQKKYDVSNINIQKAQNIIFELSATLDMSYPISKDMEKLYDYINSKLIEGNMKKDISILEEAQGLVTEFRDTWGQAMKSSREEGKKSAV